MQASKKSESLPVGRMPVEHGAPPPSPGKPKKRGLIWLVFLLIIAAVAGYAVWRAGHPAAPPKSPRRRGRRRRRRPWRRVLGPVPVVVTKVARSSIPVYLNGLGNVTAFYTVTVKSRVDGQLMKVDFNEGDLVKEGQVLAEIDPRPYQVQLDLAQGYAGARPGSAGQREGRSGALQDSCSRRTPFRNSNWIRRPRWWRSTKAPSSRIPPTSTTPSCN